MEQLSLDQELLNTLQVLQKTLRLYFSADFHRCGLSQPQLILLLLNLFVFPSLMSARMQEADYGVFLQMAQYGQISEVEVRDNEIAALTGGRVAEDLLRSHMKELNGLAQYLYAHETITGGEFTELLGAAETSAQ